ncbi:MAG: iron ABC transporter substrate-binding protein [Gammaproteobacteria bacterium]|nr:MAG: iron ABC transporter substrate-binding protein [Gammaproteobacteria bacterium]
MKLQLKQVASVVLATIAFHLPTATAASDPEVNVYSLRQSFLMQPLFDAFTKETGIKVNHTFAKKGLTERLKREGKNSPADLLLTTDIGNLSAAKKANVLQPVTSKTLENNIPSQYRDPENYWFGLTTRVRNIYASKDRVPEGAISRYEDLADPKWKGKICTRSGKHPYNVALIASMIAHHGEKDAQKWLKGVKHNLARKPQGNDRAQVKAIKEGVCDISLGNSYYYGKMLTNKKQIAWANSVNILFPNQEDRGAHVNISGMGLTRSAPNKSNAIKLMEFLASDNAQKIYAEKNFEYPVKPGVSASPLVSSWGKFSADKLPLSEIDQYRTKATKLVDKVDYDG